MYTEVRLHEEIWESLREHMMKIINLKKKKKKKLLTNKHQELNENAKISCICQENFEVKFIKNKRCCELRDH